MNSPVSRCAPYRVSFCGFSRRRDGFLGAWPFAVLPVLAIAVSVASLTLPAAGQESGLAFLKLGVDGRAAGMGDAQVASASGAFATFWNPGGLVGGSGNSVGLSHHIWIGDVRTYAIAGRFWSGRRSALGLSVISSSSGDLELRDRPGPPEGVFEARYLSAGLSYGRRFGRIRSGLTMKFISEEIFADRAAGYGLDFGGQADVAGGAVSIGVALHNVGKMSELNAEATKLPTAFRIGIEVRPFRILTIDNESLVDVHLALDTSQILPDDRTQYHVGVAVEVLEVLVLRGGAIRNDTVREFTGGVGFRYDAFGFDYAVVTFESGFGGPGHILTIGYAW